MHLSKVSLTSSPLIFIHHADHTFDCSPSTNPDSSFNIEGNILRVNAAIFDTVIDVSIPLWDMLKSPNLFQSCLELCKNVTQPYLDTNQDPTEVLSRTLIANTHESLPTSSMMLSAFKKWACNRIVATLAPDVVSYDETGAPVCNVRLDEPHTISQLAFLQDLHDTLLSARYFPSVQEVLTTIRILHRFKLQNFVARHAVLDLGDPFPTQSEQLVRVETEAALHYDALGLPVPFRRLFRTKRGFLGLGPQSMEVGDQVWLLRNARVPFVLRPREEEGCLRIIGECYLHVWMHGKMDEKVGGLVEMIRIS